MLAPNSSTVPTTTKRRRDMTIAAATKSTSTSATLRRLSKKQSQPQANTTPSPKIWRTRAQLETLSFAPLTAHKMSSVGNAFPSDDLYGSFDRSMAEDPGMLVKSFNEDPNLFLLHPQHTEVLRSSPLSIPEATFEDEEVDDSFEETAGATEHVADFVPVADAHVPVANDCGMTWNQKGNQWISLIYRYVFPASAFDLPTSQKLSKPQQPQQPQQASGLRGSAAFSPHSQRKLLTGSKNKNSSKPTPSFSFPPPQESIMMGSSSLVIEPAFPAKEQISSEAEAREACQKLLQLIDDEAMMLPLMRSSTESLKSAVEVSKTAPTNSNNPAPLPPVNVKSSTLRSLHSEWSSLPSSPPPPIFHDGCNRPIPELRLSPPMTAKQGASAKKLFTAANPPGVTESPLTKRLRMSSSASSSSLI